MVEPTHLKKICQIGKLPQLSGCKIKNMWNHLVIIWPSPIITSASLNISFFSHQLSSAKELHCHSKAPDSLHLHPDHIESHSHLRTTSRRVGFEAVINRPFKRAKHQKTYQAEVVFRWIWCIFFGSTVLHTHHLKPHFVLAKWQLFASNVCEETFLMTLNQPTPRLKLGKSLHHFTWKRTTFICKTKICCTCPLSMYSFTRLKSPGCAKHGGMYNCHGPQKPTLTQPKDHEINV